MTANLKDFSSADKCGVFQVVPDADDVAQAAKDAGLAVFRIDLKGTADKADFLSRIAQALRFPNWFGNNWDALNDCLTDLTWVGDDGWLILFEHAKDFAERNPDVFNTALEVFQAASDYWCRAGRPFWVLFHGPTDWVSGLDRFD